MYVKNYGTDFFGWFAWIKLWGKSELTISFSIKGISIGASLDISWNEEYRYMALNLFNLSITFFPEVDWD